MIYIKIYHKAMTYRISISKMNLTLL